MGAYSRGLNVTGCHGGKAMTNAYMLIALIISTGSC